ncbi:glutathione S-transferase [Methyloprofundus sedimenti]|uniref:Glutathione S-transferase n=1 Tax=Methyloprofundus sedimenti TaxID=1420851 RepID=A0A1V8M6J6_9GAMM|nr:glutathione S-transferase [Methyloprofundus sedimenti]OQK17013.1 glutathione S-transferase [Methyloprofundus sedimenti]
MTKKRQHLAPDRAILYSFRRCPYAIRARMALKYSGIKVYLREIELKNKPAEMLQSSAKGTVPVLLLGNGTIIDESRDIMHWALEQNDPYAWLPKENADASGLIYSLLDDNDFIFKNWLDRYKYADQHPEQSAEYYRSQGEQFLTLLEHRLGQHHFLMGDNVSMADIGIFPFIRQFALVDRDWFYLSPYHNLQAWLDHFIQCQLFMSVMEKYSPWTESSEPLIF